VANIVKIVFFYNKVVSVAPPTGPVGLPRDSARDVMDASFPPEGVKDELVSFFFFFAVCYDSHVLWKQTQSQGAAVILATAAGVFWVPRPYLSFQMQTHRYIHNMFLTSVRAVTKEGWTSNCNFFFFIKICVCVYIYIQDCLRKLEYCDKVLYFL